VVSVLATGPKGCRLEPGQGDGFLRAIKMRKVQCHKILRHVKELLEVPRGWID
jgi:hypothetical protein